MNCILSAVLFVLLIESCTSAGMLHIEFTADSECLIQLSHQITATDRLYPFITKTHIIHTAVTDSTFDIRTRLVRKFMQIDEGIQETHPFRLENNGKWSEAVMVSHGVSLLIRYSFICENGFFGDHCQHISQPVTSTLPPVTTSSTTIPSITEPIFNNQPEYLNVDKIVIFVLLLIVCVLVVIIVYLCSNRQISNLSRSPIKVSTVTLETSVAPTSPPRYTSTPVTTSKKFKFMFPSSPSSIV